MQITLWAVSNAGKTCLVEYLGVYFLLEQEDEYNKGSPLPVDKLEAMRDAT